MTCRCDGSGWLPEMCLGRWRCPCSPSYDKCGHKVRALHGRVWHECPMVKYGQMHELAEVDDD